MEYFGLWSLQKLKLKCLENNEVFIEMVLILSCPITPETGSRSGFGAISIIITP